MNVDIQKIREDFPILSRTVYGKPLVYFDNCETTQKHILRNCMKLPVKRYVSLSMPIARMKLSLHAEQQKVSTCLFPASATSLWKKGMK